MRVPPDLLVNHLIAVEGLTFPHRQIGRVTKIDATFTAEVRIVDDFDNASAL
jgi:hypothetical protein